MISIFHYTELTVFQVSIIYISVVTCENQITDYDLPIKDDSNYSDYYIRPCAREGQQKLTPIMFFESIYNFTSRILPEPYSPPDYKIYEERFNDKEQKIDLQKLSEINLKAEKNEKLSAIHAEEYKIASKYLNIKDKRRPLRETSFTNVLQLYELAPKPYETKETFYKARIQLGKFLIGNTPLLEMKNTMKKDLKHHEYKNGLIELSTKDDFIKGETYGQYVLRMVYLGKVPLDRETCQDLYKVQLPDENPHAIFWKLRLNLTTESLEKYAISAKLQKSISFESWNREPGSSSSSSQWSLGSLSCFNGPEWLPFG